MPTIGNNAHTFLQGLSDFWVRFFADTEELEAMYRGAEISIAQAYLDMLSSFLNISIVETPLFNLEYFKIVLAREDLVTFDEAANPADDRYVLAMPDTMVEGTILQNKVIDPTASLEKDAGYEIDDVDYAFRFSEDPTGRPERVLGTTSEGSLLTYGTGALTRFYVVNGTPFSKAKTGHWLRLTNSGSGNSKTYKIGQVLGPQAILLQGTFTLPEANNGSLIGTVLDSEFTPIEGFGHRSVTVEVGGSFDDATLRATTEIGSWYSAPPVGLEVRKGDILRVLDRNAVPVVPTDLAIALVRHAKLYMSADTPVPKDASNVSYVILREPADKSVTEEFLTFAEAGVPKTEANGSFVWDVVEQAVVLTKPVTGTPFASTDKQRYVTITGTGTISWTASIASDGTLTWTGGAVANPLARAYKNGSVVIAGSALGQDGSYLIDTLISDTVAKLKGTFLPEPGLTVTLTGITNDGTYLVKKVPTGEKLVLGGAPAVYNDPNNGAITWRIHDGYQAPLTHSRLVRGTFVMHANLGNEYTGGVRTLVEGVDFTVDYEAGSVLQVGRLNGQWGLNPLALPNVDYDWLKEVLTPGTTGTLSTADTEVVVTEVAMWAPDARVDKFHLYQNYGYLINRFEASSETYREFIRGVFQLYVLGPTLERIESALNVIAGLPVIRDEGEILLSYDDISDPDELIVTTLRPNGDEAEYRYPRGTAPNLLPIRADVAGFTTGDPDIVFEAFEPITELFRVTDYVQDPTWWDSIVIPSALMPSEGTARRTTVPFLIENVIGASDDPRIGDPGLFVGADHEGVVPPFIATNAALRSKMANVVMNTFLKQNMFFVSFDAAIADLLDPDFVQDLRELIVIAKPGYKYMFVEPANQFVDQVKITEDLLEIQATAQLDEAVMLGEDALTIQSFTWNVGDVFRRNAPQTGIALSAADGIGIPAPTNLGQPNIIAHKIAGPGAVEEYVDYELNYKSGVLTPTTIWPAGAYTCDISSLTVQPQGSKNVALGDTDYLVGGIDPERIRSRREYYRAGSIVSVSGAKVFADPEAEFVIGLHEGQHIVVPALAARYEILVVLTGTQVVLRDNSVPTGTNLVWHFPSEEPRDGQLYEKSPGEWFLKSASGMFRRWHIGRYVRIRNGLIANQGLHKIVTANPLASPVMSEVQLETTTFVAETNVHWRLEGSPKQMDLVERPLQITIT